MIQFNTAENLHAGDQLVFCNELEPRASNDPQGYRHRSAGAFMDCAMPSTDLTEETEGSYTFHTVEDVARMLQVSTKTVRRRIKNGLIKKVIMGGRLVRISSEELQRLAGAAPLKPLDQD